MDIPSITGRNSDYFISLAQNEAFSLLNKAKSIGSHHLKDAFNCGRFEYEIQTFISSQMEAIRQSKNERDNWKYIKNISEEKSNLMRQSYMLDAKSAKVNVSVMVTKHNKDSWSYVIDGIGVVLSGLQVAGGLGVISVSLASGNPIGVIAGGFLVLHGLNGISEGALNIIHDTDDSSGFLKDKYIQIAHFMGFSRGVGEVAFSAVDLVLSAYGATRLVLKPDAWRLFRYVRNDYIINFKRMGKTDLIIESYNDAIATKTIKDKS